MPEGLDVGLIKNLRIHAFLKDKFAKRKLLIPQTTLSLLTLREIQKQKDCFSESMFLNSMAELGFIKTKKYILNEKTEVSLVDQASDYAVFLLDFDNAFHASLSLYLKTPKDQVMYESFMRSNKKWPKPKKDYTTQVKAFYKYVHYLSE